MASSSSAGSSSAYESVVKGGLKLKGKDQATVGAKKRKSQHQQELEQLKALAAQQEAEERAAQPIVQQNTRTG